MNPIWILSFALMSPTGPRITIWLSILKNLESTYKCSLSICLVFKDQPAALPAPRPPGMAASARPGVSLVACEQNDTLREKATQGGFLIFRKVFGERAKGPFQSFIKAFSMSGKTLKEEKSIFPFL
jgi:hypothetical protein